MRKISMAFLLVTACLAGCIGNPPGGRGWSDDRYCYQSTPHNPMTVSLRNTWTGETIWTCEIPVGQQLVVRFVGPPEKCEQLGEDHMRWSLQPLGSNHGRLENEMVVPPPSGRRVEGTQRKGPELSSATWASGGMQTAPLSAPPPPRAPAPAPAAPKAPAPNAPPVDLPK